MTNSRPTVIFLHIPKGAGSTFRALLEQRFDPARTFTVRNPRQATEELQAVPRAERDQLRLIKGHFPYGIHELLSQPFEYITMLRDPVERMISHYYFVLRTPDHYLYNTVTSRNLGLTEYVLGGLSEELDNSQVRLISGCGRRLPYGACSREHLELAKENLQHRFSLVGLAERFDETLLLMARKFHWKDPYYVRHNVTENRPRRKELSADVIKAIETSSSLDLELYAFAQKLFQTTLRRLTGLFFGFKLAKFRARNSRYREKAQTSASVAQNHAPTMTNDTSIKLSPDTVYYHVTHWKAGSQWFRAVLKDAFGPALIEPRDLVKHAYDQPPENGKVYPCCYLTHQEFLAAPVPASARRLVLIRDLRDTLVSGYFSMRYTHSLMGQIEKYRWFLNRRSMEDGLIYLMDIWLLQSALIQRSWLKSGERVFKLEDFMARPAESLRTVLNDGWGLQASSEAVQPLVERHAFARYSGGRAPGQVDTKSHYRKGVQGDWREHFTPRVTERFKALYNDIILASGYETTPDWS